MPKPYPDPAINTTTELMEYANDVTGGWLGTLIVISTFVVMFLLLQYKHKTSEVLAISCLATLVLSAPLWLLDIIKMRIMIICLIATIASVLWAVFDTSP